MEDNNKKIIYIGIVVIIVILLSFQVLKSGEKIDKLVEETQKEDLFEIEDMSKLDSEEDIIKLENEFTTSAKDLSFKYPSGWQKADDDNILSVFLKPEAQKQLAEEYDYQKKESAMGDLEELSGTLPTQESESIGEIKFLATKTALPNFSLGVISLQKLEKKESSVETLQKKLVEEIEYADEDTKTEIQSIEKGGNFVLIEDIAKVDNRPVFKSINLGLIGKKNTYVMTFTTAHATWNDFETEFNMIISSIEFNETN